jgi:hypothetical protein
MNRFLRSCLPAAIAAGLLATPAAAENIRACVQFPPEYAVLTGYVRIPPIAITRSGHRDQRGLVALGDVVG